LFALYNLTRALAGTKRGGTKMAEKQRLSPRLIKDDDEVVASVAAMTGFKAANAAFSLESVRTARMAVGERRDNEAQKKDAADAARDDAVTAEFAYHVKVQGLKDQVIAQVGKESNEAQAVGRKKPSERKSPTRRTAPRSETPKA